MDSYTFSSDSTSSFFIKETTADENVTDMDDITNSILQLNANKVNQEVKQIGGDENCYEPTDTISLDYKTIDKSSEEPSKVFVVTIGDRSNTSSEGDANNESNVTDTAEIQDIDHESGNVSDATGSANIKVTEDLKNESDTICLNESQIETLLNSPDDCSTTVEEIKPLDGSMSNNIEFLDDVYDIGHFLSPKTDKPLNTLITTNKKNKKYLLIKKYFTECSTGTSKCNLCSEVLTSIPSNLLLHLRRTHKNVKKEMGSSRAWKYFTKLDSLKAKCNLCSSSLVYRKKISSLIKHLRAIHSDQIEFNFKSTKSSIDSDVVTENSDSLSTSLPSDVIVIQNSDGKLLNQIKVNKTWKCFTKLPNSDKMICNLCKKIFTHNKTKDLLQHLHEEHKNLLSIKQQAAQQSLNEIETSYSAEESVKKIVYTHTDEPSKSVIVQKVSKHPVRLGKSWKSSKIWGYFEKLNNEKIECKLCRKLLANNYSTSNLLRHLNARHPEAYSAIQELSTAVSESIKIMIQNDKGQPEKDVSVADMLEDYENMLSPNENTLVEEIKIVSKVRQPMSETWSYYTKLEDIAKVKCNICDVKLAYNEGISSNLTRHLKLKHKNLFGKDGTYIDNTKGVKREAVDNQNEVNNDDILTTAETINEQVNETNEPELPDSQKIDETINDESVLSNDVNNSGPPDSSALTEIKVDKIDNINGVKESIENDKELKTSLQDKQSKPWDYFKKIQSENKAICNLCSQEMEFLKGSTYKLFRHLAVKHDITFKRAPKPRKIFSCESDSSDEESAKNKSTQKHNKSTANSASQLPDLLSDNDYDVNESHDSKRSDVKVTGRTWKHFTKLDRDKAKCNICSKVFTYKLGQTSHLIKHIQLQHKDIDSRPRDKVVKPLEIKDSQNKVKKKQPSAFSNNPNVVWNYFTKLEDCKAMCNLCEFPNVLSHHKNSSSNLCRHLNRKHKYVFENPSDDTSFIQRPDTYNASNDRDINSSISEDCEIKTEVGMVRNVERDDELEDMKSFFEYLATDEKLKKCIKYENNQIKCKICSGSFVCENLINYEYTIRYHVQIFHAEWTVMCFDETLVKRECVSPVSEPEVLETSKILETPDIPESNYNELEAIENEVNSFMNLNEKPVEVSLQEIQNQNNKNLNKKVGGKSLGDDIWKYFTKLTSQNVRCNFCSIMLSFRQHKKWNLIRHLKLKHKSKVNISLYNKHVGIKRIKNNIKSQSSTKSLKSIHPKISSKRSTLIKPKSKKLVKGVSNDSPVKKIKIDSNVDAQQPETNKEIVIGKKNSSPDKPHKTVKPKEDSPEKKQVSLASFNTPINRRIGRTWSHFTKIEMGKAECNICNIVLLYRGTGIDLLNDHLTSKHSNYFDGSSNSEMLKNYTKKTNFDIKSLESSDESDSDEKKQDVSNSISDHIEKEDDSNKKVIKDRVWQYFTKDFDGFVKCDLCLSEISYKGSTNNLVRHLQKIHSVISLLSPEKEVKTPEETEQSKLLAAVDLTPTRAQAKSNVCFIRLNKNMVRCNFCPRILHHKSGNMHKLFSHMLYKHRQEMKKVKSLKNVRFIDNGKEVVLKINEKQEKLHVSFEIPEQEPKVDKRKIYRSNTWLYFTKLNDHYAKCNICSNSFSYKGGSIFNLTRHLLIKHDVKLIKRFDMPHKKFGSLSLPTPKSGGRKRSETLLFYKRIDRYAVRCKLCMKRFPFNGTNMNKLISHLWTNHITKLIGPQFSNIVDNNDSNEDIEGDHLVTKDTVKKNPVKIRSDRVLKDKSCTRKIGSTWNYFTDLNDAQKNVRCNICLKVLCFRSGNVSNLSRHLERNHKIKKNSDFYRVQSSETSNVTSSDNVSFEDKEKVQNVDNSEEMSCVENNGKDKAKIIQDEIYTFFLKSNFSEDEVQCKFCDESLKRGNLIDLKSHLLVKHDINDFLVAKNELSEDTNKLLLPTDCNESKSCVTLERIKMVKAKCKLCYKEIVYRKNTVISLIEHLTATHGQDLKENEKCMLQENLWLKPVRKCEETSNVIENEVVENNADINEIAKETMMNLKLKHLVLNYFKDLRQFKNKCTICCKFISTKKPCYHRITNDLSVRYSVCKTKRKIKEIKVVDKEIKSDDPSVKSENYVNGDSSKTKSKYRNDKIKHFMSVNLYDNKCYDCMAARNDGYCVHSLNLWITNENKKKIENSKINSEYNNQVSLNSDEVQIIADSLNGCSENNIIIITDNEDASVLNYDLTNRSEGGHQDISYHIMNSINDIDDEDIKVIIYNYNSEGTGNESQVTSGDGVKIEGSSENTSVNTIQLSSNRALEEHITNIVNRLNSAQSTYNSVNALKDKEDAPSDPVEKEESSLDQANDNIETLNKEPHVEDLPDLGTGFRRSYDLEKLAEVSCNEQFYKQNSLMNYTDQSENEAIIKGPPVKSKIISQSSSDRCIVENIYPENDSVENSIAIEKEYVTHDIVCTQSEEVANCDVAEQPQTNCIEHDTEPLNKESQPLAEISEQPLEDMNNKTNEVISEDVINAIFNEVIVNLHESPEEKELSLIKLNNDNIEIPSGLYLQNLKGQYRINKILLNFSNINYKYKTAKCSLCKICLEFVEPVIYNLLMHLFTYHKEKVCIDEPINKTLLDENATSDNINRPRRKSPVWKYFINDKNFRATCKICCFSFSYKGGAINNLSRHLRLRHNITVSPKNSVDTDYDVNCLHYDISYPKRRSTVRLRSKTWNYFTKEPNDWAKCRICKKYLSYRSSTINNLTRHLRTIHSKIFSSLFTDKEPIFIKNEDGTLSENVNYINNDGDSDIYNSLIMETTNTKSRDEILQQCSYSSLEKNKKKSIVWNYFTEITPSCGKCNFCSKVISCKGGGTSNLSRHLRSRHGIWIVLTSNLSQTFNETMNDSELNQNMADGNSVMNDTIITQEQLHILKNRKLVHKKSKTWEYFTKETAERVRCNLCSKPLSYKCKAVHNLRRHLTKKHPSYVVKPDPIRLKLQINTENDVLHNSNELQNPLLNESDKKFIDITDTSVVIVDEETQVPPNRPDRNVRPKKSIVWNYFEELEYGVAKCLICSKILSFRGGGTNNLMRHLRCRHAIIIVSQLNIDLEALDKEPVVVMSESECKEESEAVGNLINSEQESIELSNVLINDSDNIQSV